MNRIFPVAACILGLGACTTVRISHDGTNTITHEDASASQALADRACRKAGEQSAIVISTVNKDPSLPAGKGEQVTTFRCSSDSR